MRTDLYRLPDGTNTPSIMHYVGSWRELCAPIEKALGWRVIGHDPGVLFRTPSGATYDMPVEDVRALAKVIDAVRREAKKEERKLIESAVQELARMVPVGPCEMETTADDDDPDGWWGADDVLNAIRVLRRHQEAQTYEEPPDGREGEADEN